MGTIAEREKDTYETMFGIEAYSVESPGETFAPLFVEMAKPKLGELILDAGCGSGKGTLALRALGHSVIMADLVDARCEEARLNASFTGGVCLWDDLYSLYADWTFCCDVLEHIPTEFTMLVVANLLKIAHRGVFFSIALEPDNFGALIGKSLHQTVKPFTWWRDRLVELGTIIECRDLLTTGLYLVTR